MVSASQSGSYTTALSDGTEVVSEINVPEAIELTTGDRTVEDWKPGQKVTITEDRGLGIRDHRGLLDNP